MDHLRYIIICSSIDGSSDQLMNPLRCIQTHWWIPYVVYKSTDGSPTPYTYQLMDSLLYIKISWWIPYAVYKSIDGSPIPSPNQLMDSLRYIKIIWWIPYAIYKSIDGSPYAIHKPIDESPNTAYKSIDMESTDMDPSQLCWWEARRFGIEPGSICSRGQTSALPLSHTGWCCNKKLYNQIKYFFLTRRPKAAGLCFLWFLR